MRICLVSETWSPDINGVAHTLNQLSRELQERGIEAAPAPPTDPRPA